MTNIRNDFCLTRDIKINITEITTSYKTNGPEPQGSHLIPILPTPKKTLFSPAPSSY